MNESRTEILEKALRWFLGVLLLWAAISTIANPTGFLGSVYLSIAASTSAPSVRGDDLAVD